MACLSAEELARLAEHATDGAAAHRVHLDSCAACREVMRVVRAAGSGEVAAVMPEMAAGEAIGRYVVLRAIAQGGMADVYLGYDPVLDRNLALKLVRTDRDTDAFAARLAREAQVLAKLAHPNVVRVFDAGSWHGLGYVAMEYLDGESLRAWSAHRSRGEILRVLVGAGHGIAAAHELGIVHRDVKPDNILVGGDGVGRIADFGLVAAAGHLEHGGAPRPGSTDGRSAVGTRGYCAPEVMAGAIADTRSDQWSFCAAACEVLFGALPASAAQVPAGPRHVARVLRRGLDADPGRRFRSMGTLVAALERRPRRVWIAGAGATFAIACAIAWLMIARDPLAHCDDLGPRVVADASPLQSEAFARRFDVLGPVAGPRRAATERELRSYTTKLAARALGACRAERANPTAAALQAGCVADRRRELTALVAVLQHADRGGLEQAANAIARLPDPASCDDPGRLATLVPAEPAARAEADRITGQVAALRSRFLVGERDALLPAARDLVARSERLGVATVALAAAGLLGDLLGDGGDMTAATDAHLAAARHAASAHGDTALARRLIRAAETAAAALAFERAAALLASAEIYASRAGDPAIVDDLDAARGELALQRHDAGKAVAICRALVDRLRARTGATSLDALNARYELARAYFADGQLDASADVARAAIADLATAYGADHPDTLPFHSELSRIAEQKGDRARAEQEDLYQLGIACVTYGDDSPLVADVASNLAALYVQLDRNREAVEYGKQAVAIGERHASHKQHVYLAQLALAYLQLGNTKQGVPLLERSLALREQIFGADSPELVKPLTALGLAAANADDLVTARRHWGRAVAILTRMASPPASGIVLMRDLASILDDRTAKQRMLADADALERRRAKP